MTRVLSPSAAPPPRDSADKISVCCRSPLDPRGFDQWTTDVLRLRLDLRVDRCQRIIQIDQWLERNLDHVAVAVDVEQLVLGESLRVLDFNQRKTAPGRAVPMEVLDSLLHAAPIPGFRHDFMGDAPRGVEHGPVNGPAVLEALQIDLTHCGSSPRRSLTVDAVACAFSICSKVKDSTG